MLAAEPFPGFTLRGQARVTPRQDLSCAVAHPSWAAGVSPSEHPHPHPPAHSSNCKKGKNQTQQVATPTRFRQALMEAARNAGEMHLDKRLCLLAQQAKAHHPHRSKRFLTTALGEQKRKSQNDSVGKPTYTHYAAEKSNLQSWSLATPSTSQNCSSRTSLTTRTQSLRAQSQMNQVIQNSLAFFSCFGLKRMLLRLYYGYV